MPWLIVVPLLILVLALTAFWLIGERGHVMLPSTYRVFRELRCVEPRSDLRPGTSTCMVAGPGSTSGTLLRFVFRVTGRTG